MLQLQAQLSFAATRQVNMQENLHPQRAKPVGTMPTNPCWLSLDFVETLLDLGSCGEHYQEVWEVCCLCKAKIPADPLLVDVRWAYQVLSRSVGFSAWTKSTEM